MLDGEICIGKSTMFEGLFSSLSNACGRRTVAVLGKKKKNKTQPCNKGCTYDIESRIIMKENVIT